MKSRMGNRSGNPRTGDEPLGDYPRQFLLHLEAQHYAQTTITEYTSCINALGDLMRELEIDAEALDGSNVEHLIERLQSRTRRKSWTAFIVRRFARYITELDAVNLPLQVVDGSAHAEVRREYQNYLRHQRGLSERTIYHCWRFADRFLKFRFGDQIDDLSQITSDDIVRFLQRLMTRRRSSFRDRTPPTHLRNFFQYLFKAGKTPVNLALGLPNIRRQYGARLPRHLTPDQVDTLVEAVRSGSPEKLRRRNYAMVLLLARLGLRATEVAAMQLDDIDWRSGEILVRGKGNRQERLPLPADVGQALADYIRLDRVATSRALFVAARAPHSPFKDSQILNEILKQAFARTGLSSPAPYVGSHVLRHSLAVELARRGGSLEEIGDLLRHRARASTMIYARLDLEGLRSIAQPWPVAGGAE